MTAATNWTDANQRELLADLARIRAALERAIAGAGEVPQASARVGGVTTALDTLCSLFGLSPFERGILLLCAGVEMQADFPGLCAGVNGNAALSYPTFSLAMSVLPDPHWSALAPSEPLRRWRLIEMHVQPAVPLVSTPLRIDERILHFLAGIKCVDERLAGVIEPVAGDALVPSHHALAGRVVKVWKRRDSRDERLPLIQLLGASESDRRAVAASACRELGLALSGLCVEDLPTSPPEFDSFLRLWEREAVLSNGALLVEMDNLDAGDARQMTHLSRFLERIRGAVLLSARDRWKPLRRAVHIIDVRRPTPVEQQVVWQELLQGTALGDPSLMVGRLSAQFNLSLPAIRESVSAALGNGARGDRLEAELCAAGLAQARPRFDGVAHRIDARAQWDDLILPVAEKSLLTEIAANVRQRATVYGTWGFSQASGRGLGISALFSGASGTGKTLAAEVLANVLALDLYRIDLSAAVSKYIGETEKNLRRVFDAAEEGGAILFFDEADALFGKRSEVKDSHDRYANIEINYLLQRIEEYRGLAVLATNMKSALDPAFLRRIRFVVNFPFPGVEQRAEIWRRVFPACTPIEGLDIDRLATLEVAGGNIRNIALSAAFLAAEEGQPVRMPHILRAVRTEFSKVEKPFTHSGEGWGA